LVFVISAHSAASSECRREFEEAEREHKKVIPVVIQDVANDQLPEGLTRQNWVSFVNRDGWEHSLGVLIEALDTDIEWRDMHTRLLMRAEEWISSDKDRSFLLRGRDLQSAEDWYERRGSHRETPTDDQVGFIVASRRGVSRRLRVVTVAVACGLVVSLLAAAIAIVQRQSAVQASQQSQSEQMAAEAHNLLSTNVPLGMLLSIEAYERAPTAQAQDALTQSALVPLQEVSRDHAARVMSVALSPKADEVASGDFNGMLVLRNEHTGASRSWKTGGTVNTLAFSPNGSSLVTSGFDGVVSLWDVATGDRAATWNTGGSVWSVAFSPDGRTVATGGDGGQLGLWEVTTGKQVVWHDPGIVGSVAFTPDGKDLLTSDSGGLVALWDLATRSQLASWSVGSAAWLAVSPDGSTIAVADADGQIVLIDRATGLKTILSDGSTVNAVAFSPDGRSLASGDTAGLVSVWDLANGTRTTVNAGAEVSSVAFSPDGRALVTGDWDGNVIRWNGSTMRAAGSVTFIASAPGNGIFATGDLRGHVAVWNASTGHPEQGWNEGAAISGLTVSPDGTVLASTNDHRQVTLLNRKTGSMKTWQSDAEQSAPAFSPDGRSLYTLSSDALLRWDVATGRSTSIARVGFTIASVNSVDGRLLAVIGADGRLAVWRVATGTRLASWPMSTKAGVLAFGDNDRLLAVEPADGQVSLWNLVDHTRVSDWNDGATVWDAVFTPNGKYLATVDNNGQVGLWDIAKGSHRSWSDGAALYGIVVSSDGRTVFTGDANGLVTANPTVAWTGSFTTIRSMICARLGGVEMSPAQWHAYVPNSSFAHICPADESRPPRSS
jgi:WD40 repeat protein